MNGEKNIQSVLISVFNKDNLEGIIEKLRNLNVTFYSTGGTQEFLESLNCKVVSVESVTSYPSILGGRVKTLHPKIFGGILTRRNNKQDAEQIEQYDIPEIDAVIVDLYPFEHTVQAGASESEIIEKIDIGGISLIRAAAKNYEDVLIVASQAQYAEFDSLLAEKNGTTTKADRKRFAAHAFSVSSHYDSAIFNYFNTDIELPCERISLNNAQPLRYGENPQQKATFYPFANTPSAHTLSGARILQGKELSYNNMLDADAAWKAASDAFHAVNHIQGKVAVAVVKHLNPCGLAVSDSAIKALELAWAGDPISAFGGILCFTTEVDEQVATWLYDKFIEILIAPSFSTKAQEILAKKKNVRVLEVAIKPEIAGEKLYRSINGGLLVQNEDEGIDTQYTQVTQRSFNAKQIDLATFGTQACKHLKSNAIAVVSEHADGSYWLTGAGMGQPNRLDSLRWLTMPRFNLKEHVQIETSVLISDAFFPFRDSVEAAHEYNVQYIVQPGGSIRDDEVIAACNEYNIAMVFTGKRHFKH